MKDSNLRHPRCKRGALPAELIALKKISYSLNDDRPTAKRKTGQRTLLQRDSVLVDGVLQAFACLEFRLVRRWNLDWFAGARITSFGRLPTRDAKRSETDKPDFRARLERTGDRIEYGVDGFSRVSLAQASAI